MDISSTPPRSILFVPGHRPELAAKAAGGEADAVCIDLEDGVPADARDGARRELPKMAAALSAGGKPVLVRVNAQAHDYAEDIEALPDEVVAVVLAKASGWEQIESVASLLDGRGLGALTLVPMLEDIAGIDAYSAMRAEQARRIAAITVGVEDLAANLQCAAGSRAVEHAFYRVLECARRLDVPLLGYPGTIAEYTDLDLYRELVLAGVEMGAVGAFCVHPRQVGVLNEAFLPDAEEIAWAREVLATIEDTGDDRFGAVGVNGRMVDRPVVLRARRIVARAQAFNA